MVTGVAGDGEVQVNSAALRSHAGAVDRIGDGLAAAYAAADGNAVDRLRNTRAGD
jgi:hypothetical protein